ncbi:MAG TPA: type II 3-dehydroquinate dehydratase [Longimicrobiaceae bacterium]|nr:type II 3-dehydroquinate dehydratase [Longimicrobiaceae bacterium]
MKIAVVHGPNLNLLGQREPGLYGSATLAEVNAGLAELGRELGAEISVFQSNGEGALVDHVQSTGPGVDGFVVNAGAYTHTSIALRDALLAVGRPFVEVHLSNVFARESFRHHSFLSDRAVGVVAGFGPESYLLGLRALVGHLERERDRA